ncbi:hypothetical protein IQ247_22285 [Plectonema cf. radiosum LEGE 06105]|uniref:Uncharacterized protein n=1 Tax=Plectonema cf. radiosum LEGE 06105 TaxID=945769 RepID=A0A8J7F6A3_9CYAN|nr:hypothetical protein [Plectonema radiosum]MBE9215358.1 hypothetical protein [Plectonema cf. radiosum LEGE 06105]
MDNSQEILVEKNVKYNVEFNGKVVSIENVPVRINEETQEYYVSSTVVQFIVNVVLEQFTQA